MSERKSKPPKKRSRKGKRASQPAMTAERDSSPAVEGDDARDSSPVVEGDARDSSPAVEGGDARDSSPTVEGGDARDSSPEGRDARDSSPAVEAAAVEAPPVESVPTEGTHPVETAAIVATTTETESKVITVASEPDVSMPVVQPTGPAPASPASPPPPPKPELGALPSLLEVPALSSPRTSLATSRDELPEGAKVELREGARRSGDDRRREVREEQPAGDGKPDPSSEAPIIELRPTAGERVDAATGELVERRGAGGDRRKDEPSTAAAVGEPTPFLTDPEAATLPAPEEPRAGAPLATPILDPKVAALEAARIAGEIVGDISTASGAAIVAAAAAGAAIEAARQQQAAGVSTVAPQAAGAAAAAAVAAATSAAKVESPPASDGTTGDPVTTVRMQRERILRALAEDIAVNPPLGEAKDPVTSAASPPVARTASQAEARPTPVEGEQLDDDQLDPVQIAAAAIQRLRARASTDIANIRGHYHRHDLVVLLAALIIIVVAARLHVGMVTPPTVSFPEHENDPEAIARGLTFQHSTAWLKPERLPPWPPRLARDPTGQPPKANDAYYAALTSSVDPNARIEILIDKRPAWTNIVTGLELDRRQRWGELYTLDASAVEEIEDQNWLRTAYRYAHAPEKGDVPRVDRAVEYATVDREQIYVVTLFGTEQELSEIEAVVAPTLRVPQKPGSRSALPLVPQTRGATHRSYPDPVAKAFDSTVMIVVADMIDGRLQARGGGSGVIVGADGSILTNYHVIHDKNGRLHDVFVVGRFSQLDQAPQLQCAGRPNRSKLQRELDLALLKCDTDLDGRTWTPSSVGIWQTLAPSKTTDLIGQRLWVLGFPDVGGGGLTLSTGEIGGWTGQDGAAGRDFIKTDASITHGNSGGPAVDDKGRLIGIATASRTKLSQGGGVIETKQVGLVRPLTAASDLLAIASIGWTPREGHTDVEIQPSAVEASPEGIRIATHVIDHSNDAPIRDALVMVLKGGVKEGSIDINRLDDQVIAWGRSNTQGEVALKQPVPFGTYTVLVRASGYQPLIGDNALTLDDKSPTAFDPWGGIRLRPL